MTARAVTTLLALGLCATVATGQDRSHPADAASRSPTSPIRYVALGDSYSSGEGLAPYLRGTAGSGCHRSSRAFPPRFAMAGRIVSSVSAACSGALTENVGWSDASGSPAGVSQTRKQVSDFQLAAVPDSAWRNVDLVTVTIGGNDAGFGNGLRVCLVIACESGEARSRILSAVGGVGPRLAATYAAIRRRAPRATVVVLGYPQLFPAAGQNEPGCVQGYPRRRQLFLRGATVRLDQTIAKETRRAGLFFVPVARLFAGHEPCGRKLDWMFGVQHGLTPASYHPNATGQRVYARGLQEFLRCLKTSRWRAGASGLPRNPLPGRAAPSRCTPDTHPGV